MAMDLYRARPHDGRLADLLGIAYAANEVFDKAARLGERALGIAEDEPQLAGEIRGHLRAYRLERPVYLPTDRMDAEWVVQGIANQCLIPLDDLLPLPARG